MLILIGDRILLTNSDFQSRNAKITRFWNRVIIRVSDQIYFRLINSAKYSIPAMRDNYTVQQFEGIVQNELDAIDGVGLKC